MNRIGSVIAAAGVLLLAACGSTQESNPLTVAMIPVYPPNSSLAGDGSNIGWEPQLAEAIGKQLGRDVEFHNVTYQDFAAGVADGEYDFGMASLFPTQERLGQFDMVSYFQTGSRWFAPAGAGIDPSHACGLRVAVIREAVSATHDVPAASAACEAAQAAPVTAVPVDSLESLIGAVTSGQADAGIVDAPAAIGAVEASSGALELVGESYDPQEYGMVFARGSELAPKVAEALSAIAEQGDYQRILDAESVGEGAIEQFEVLRSGQ